MSNGLDTNYEDRRILSELKEISETGIMFTDILIQQDAPIRIKTPVGWEVSGLQEIPTAEDIESLLKLIEIDWEVKLKSGAINKAFDLEQWRFRASAYLANGGMKRMVSIRKLSVTPPSLKDTGLPSQIEILLGMPRGLLLFSGATGSGKSTSMGAILSHINDHRMAHIITIEDPIEYVFKTNKAVFSQREVGVDVRSFSEGVREAMRQRPDVLMIGEIRDRETAEAALLCAESGHFVIGGLHANSTAGAIQKILSFFSDQEAKGKLVALQNTLIGVVSQILLPREDKKALVLASELLLNHTQQHSEDLADAIKLRKAFNSDNNANVSMVSSLAKLVKSNTVSKADALIAAGREQQELSKLI